MELWHAWGCPYCMRVRIALAEKGVAYEEREVDLSRKPPELFTVNPLGGVPVLVDGEEAVSDSMAVLDHLESRYPDPPLVPREAQARARALELYDRVNMLLAPHLQKVSRGAPEEKAAAEREVRAALGTLEGEATGPTFLLGALSVADLALSSFVAKLPPSLRPSGLGLPRLTAWEAAVFSRPSVARHTAPRRPA